MDVCLLCLHVVLSRVGRGLTPRSKESYPVSDKIQKPKNGTGKVNRRSNPPKHSVFCNYAFRIILIINRDYLLKQRYPADLCNGEELRSLWGADWIHIYINPKIHHRTHNSPPPVPFPSHSNPIHIPQANLPKIHSDPIFIFVLRPVPRLCVVIRNKYWVLRGRVASPPPNPQAGGPLTVGCPRLLFQYIRSYPPCLEAVSSFRNPRTRHALVTVDPLNMVYIYLDELRFKGLSTISGVHVPIDLRMS
jgi:hypothetical protein